MAATGTPPDRPTSPPEGFPRPVIADRPWDALLERIGPIDRRRVLTVLVVLGLLGAAAWWLLRPGPTPIEQVMPVASAAAAGGSPGGPPTTAAGSGPAAPDTIGATTTSSGPTEVVVQAAGAVTHPGVYRLPAAARVDDLVREAGGVAGDADLDRVNLAAPLVDGQRVWVPRRGQAVEPAVVNSGGPSVAASGSAGPAGTGDGGAAVPTPQQPIDLNTATAEQLDTLPGVGPATAAAILQYRQEHGSFGSVDDLLEVRGIGDARMEQLRPLVRV